MGLRLRLRADDHERRGLHEPRRPVHDRLGLQPERQRLPGDAQQRHHRHERGVAAGRADCHGGAGATAQRLLARRAIPGRQLRHQRPCRPAGRCRALQLLHGRRLRPPGLVHRRRRRKGQRHAGLLLRPGGRPRAHAALPGWLQRRRLQGHRQVHRRLGLDHGRRRAGSRPRLLPGAPRPVRLRLQRPWPERPRRHGLGARALRRVHGRGARLRQ